MGLTVEPFTILTSVAAALPAANIETDVIIPARMCVRRAGADYADALFAPWRFAPDGSEDPTFVLNRPGFREARILVTGPNFGFGSSREQAVWALRDFGVRAILAESFAGIFAGNCVRCGILPATLTPEHLGPIVAQTSGRPTELTVDLPRQVVSTPSQTWPFELNTLDRQLLSEGLDATSLVLRHVAEIAEFERARRGRRAWLYEPLARPR